MRVPSPLSALALAVAGAFTLAACDGATQPMDPAGGEATTSSGAAFAPSPPVPTSPLRMDYIKTESGPGTFNWFGFVSGDINGNLETQVVVATQSGKSHILHIQTVWTVTDAGLNPCVSGANFIANLDGTLDTNSGKLLLNGEIVSGFLAGAQVHDEGVLTGFTLAGGTIFEGTLRIMPPSAD